MTMSEGTLRFGFLSAAAICHGRAGKLRSVPGAELHAVAARDKGRAEAFAQKHGVGKAYGSYAELIDDPDVDCVYLAMPSSLRAEWVERAARAGKHVLCEKPAANSVEELVRMLEVCEDNDVLFMDGTVFVHNKNGIEMVRRKLTKEVGGRIDAARCELSIECTSGIRVDGLEPLGALGDLGWYCARWALALSGFCPPARVECELSRNERGVPIAARGRIQLGFPFTFACDFAGPPGPPTQSLTVEGPAGSALIGDLFGLTDHEALADKKTPVRLFETFVRTLEAGDPRGFKYWHDMALHTQKILDACLESAASGEPATIKAVVPRAARVPAWAASAENRRHVAEQRSRAASPPARSPGTPSAASGLAGSYADTGVVVLECDPAAVGAVGEAFQRIYAKGDRVYNRLQALREKWDLEGTPLGELALEKLKPALRCAASVVFDRTLDHGVDPMKLFDLRIIHVDVAKPGCRAQHPHWDMEAGCDWTLLTVPLVAMNETNGAIDVWPATQDIGPEVFPPWSRVSLPRNGRRGSRPDNTWNMELESSGVLPEVYALADEMQRYRCSARVGEVILRRPSVWHRGTEHHGSEPRAVLTIGVEPRRRKPATSRWRPRRFLRRARALVRRALAQST